MAHTSNIAPNSSSKSDRQTDNDTRTDPKSTSVVKVASLKKRLRREKKTPESFFKSSMSAHDLICLQPYCEERFGREKDRRL